MRHKRHCGKGLKPQMWTNDPCRAELPRRKVWGAVVDSGAPRNFGMEMLRARATGRIHVPRHGEKHQACLSPVFRVPQQLWREPIQGQDHNGSITHQVWVLPQLQR